MDEEIFNKDELNKLFEEHAERSIQNPILKLYKMAAEDLVKETKMTAEEKSLLDLKKAIHHAMIAWTCWDWPVPFGGRYYDSRPADDDTREGADAAREYDDKVHAAVVAAQNLAAQAFRHLRDGKMDEVRRCVNEATRLEGQFGEVMSWRRAHELVSQL